MKRLTRAMLLQSQSHPPSGGTLLVNEVATDLDVGTVDDGGALSESS